MHVILWKENTDSTEQAKKSIKIYNYRHTKRMVKVLHKSLSLPTAKRVVKVLYKYISRPFSLQVKKIDDFSTLKLRHAKTAYLTA
jgi:hypothetical protein